MNSANSTLHIRARDAHGQVVDVARLRHGSITAGSAPHNALVLPSPEVAPTQFRVDWDGESTQVTVVNIGENSIDIGGVDVPAQTSLTWDGNQFLRAGPYSLKLVGAPAMTREQDEAATQVPAKQNPPPSRWPLALALALAAVFALVALGAMLFGVLARPAEILSFALTDAADSDGQRSVQFAVRNAQRIALIVDGHPADPLRLRFDAQTGVGAYAPNADERAFELVAYNALGQPTASQLTVALVPTPTTAPTPNPTATPLPGDPFVAEFSFNDVNKANELSDLLLNKGDGLVIAWNVANVAGVELQPAGTFRAQDSIRVAPQETTLYTLLARNAFGEAKRSVKVIVIDARATAEANAAAGASAKATQDAIAAANAQSAATATASTRATATAIALVLADAQARATQASLEGTATAAAQATALTAGTAQAGATQQVLDASGATATAIVQATSGADTARFAQFNGTWVNQTPAATGLVRLVIGNAGPAITVQAFDACTPQPCDWGPRTQTYTDAPFLVRYDFGDGSSRTLLLEPAGEVLRVQDVDSRGPVRVYTFVRA